MKRAFIGAMFAHYWSWITSKEYRNLWSAWNYYYKKAKNARID